MFSTDPHQATNTVTKIQWLRNPIGISLRPYLLISLHSYWYLVVVVVHLHWYSFLVNIPYRPKIYSALLLNVVTSYIRKERWSRKWYTGVQTLYLKLDFLLWSELWKMGRTKLAAGSLNSSSSCEASVFAIYFMFPQTTAAWQAFQALNE